MGTVTASFPSATLGTKVDGELCFAEESDSPITVYTTVAPFPPSHRVTSGWGYFGQRVFSRPQDWTKPGPASVSGKITATISISSVSGALVGKIRTDCANSIVQSLKFTDDQKGSADLTLELNKLPDFPLLPRSTIRIAIGNTSFSWYNGILDYTDIQGTPKDKYTFTAFGPRKGLDDGHSSRIFTPPLDIGVIMDTLAQDIAAEFPINYNPSKIQLSTGSFIVTTNDLSRQSYTKVLDTYAAMCGNTGAYWGVDGDGDFFFRLKDSPDDLSRIVKTYFVGYDVTDFNPQLNVDSIINSVTVQRQNGRGSGGAGWVIIGVYNDDTSIKKYELKQKNFLFPGSIGDDDGATIGAALLAQNATPRYSGEATGKIVISGDDYLPRGNYRIIMPPSIYTRVINDCDTASDFAKVGSGDLSLTASSDILVSGSGSIRMAYSSALNDRAELTMDLKAGTLKTILIWLYSVRTSTVTIGIGAGAWNQYTKQIAVNVTGQFFGVEWDVSALGITHITKFGIRIDDAAALGPNYIYFDKLETRLSGSQHYILEKKETKYEYDKDNQKADITFGALPPKLYDFVANVMSTAQEASLTQQKR